MQTKPRRDLHAWRLVSGGYVRCLDELRSFGLRSIFKEGSVYTRGTGLSIIDIVVAGRRLCLAGCKYESLSRPIDGDRYRLVGRGEFTVE